MVVVYLYLNMKTQEIFVINFVITYCNIHMVITVHNRISIFMH